MKAHQVLISQVYRYFWWNILGIVHLNEKCSVIVNAEALICNTIMSDRTTQKKTKMNELRRVVLAHSLYSSNIAPSDFRLFRSLQHFLRQNGLDNNRYSNFIILFQKIVPQTIQHSSTPVHGAQISTRTLEIEKMCCNWSTIVYQTKSGQ